MLIQQFEKIHGINGKKLQARYGIEPTSMKTMLEEALRDDEVNIEALENMPELEAKKEQTAEVEGISIQE